ncbi:MAG TPA: hypothetical protein VFB58_01570 [Chloroflexota bacterium]|nr:hypothetical protein [Chloroflexota bacterium]
MDDDRDLDGLSESERRLADDLRRLAPLMREQESVEGIVSAGFRQALRDHLVYGEEVAPHPTFARALREHLLASRPIAPAAPLLLRRPVWISAMATVIAVLAVLLVSLVERPARPAFAIPRTTRADLLFNLPTSEILVRSMQATVSLIHPRPASPYAGRLSLTAHALPLGPAAVAAYRLGPPPRVMAQVHRLLHIHAAARRIRIDETDWIVAQDGGGHSGRPVHSLAISEATGEVIYHDRRNFQLPHANHPLGAGQAVLAARRWLTRLGWPGRDMPLIGISIVPRAPLLREIALGWRGVRASAIPEATLWVAPNRSVIEAWIWPPVASRTTLGAIPTSEAWDEIRQHAVPVVIAAIGHNLKVPGTGGVAHVSVAEILVTTLHHGAYLVPSYRFSGRVLLARHPHPATWLSFVPSTQ